MSLINLQTGEDMTGRFRTNKEIILDSAYRNQNILPICETFERSDFDVLLAQSNCKKIRIYFSMQSDLKVRAVVVGVNSSDEDILTAGNEKIVEVGQVCPPICPPSSPLNS